MFLVLFIIMKLANIKFKKNFSTKRVVKIISGLSNFDLNYIVRVVKAAQIGRADYVDIAANTEIISVVKSCTKIPICVSSIDSIDLYRCIVYGADMVEIGNFDFLDSQGIVFSGHQIIQLAQEIRLLLPNSIICVTIPHRLLLDKQMKLASNLKSIGICMVQTEGLSTKLLYRSIANNYISHSIHKASAALSSSYAISQSIDIPVISSSGINSISALIAIAYQASGVGIGSLLKNFNTIYEMSNCISDIVASLSYYIYGLPQKKSLKIHKCVNFYIQISVYI
uniref:Uncharacterized protein ycf23 n=1 Tax=Sarcopeltis skottsbergii TaxID=2765380 RepID=A0A7M1VMQ2_SARSK|nr:hypothetical protein [Sarcopeltis skottsbergii]